MKTANARLPALAGHFFVQLEEQIGALRRQGREIIRLDMGSPDLPPAPEIIATLARAAAEPDSHGYQPLSGPASLRAAWAAFYQREYGVQVQPQTQVVNLLGSKEGIFHLMQVIVEPGDVVLLTDPGYRTYAQAARFAGAEPYFLPLRPQDGFLPDLEAASAAVPADVLRRARVLWLNYPNNPTGAVASEQFFAGAVEFARRNDILLCHDAAYNQVVFDDYRSPSVLQIPGAFETAVEFSTLSKSHNMAGWRVGAAVGNADVLRALAAIETNVNSGHFGPIWQAAETALTGDQAWLAARNAEYARRRDLAAGALCQMGFEVTLPKAALYLWFPVPSGWAGSVAFTNWALEQSGVSLTPGVVFGSGGEGYIRLALTSPYEILQQAMSQLGQAIEQRGNR